MQLLEARVTVQLFEEGLQKWSSSGCGEEKNKKTMQPFWHLVRRVIAQEGGNLCVISVRLEAFAKHAKVTQPEARNPTEKNREEQLVPATRAVRGFNTSHMHAAQVQIRKVKSCRVVQRTRIVWLARLDHNFSCVRLFFTPTSP